MEQILPISQVLRAMRSLKVSSWASPFFLPGWERAQHRIGMKMWVLESGLGLEPILPVMCGLGQV